jgi:hypothetical protein
MYKVEEKLHDLIPELFLDCPNRRNEPPRAEWKPQAQSSAQEKEDAHKVAEEDQDAQDVIGPESMKDLLKSLVDKQIGHPRMTEIERPAQNTALREARKQYLGGAKAAKTPPGKQQGHGRTPKGTLKRVSFGTTTQPQPR